MSSDRKKKSTKFADQNKPIFSVLKLRWHVQHRATWNAGLTQSAQTNLLPEQITANVICTLLCEYLSAWSTLILHRLKEFLAEFFLGFLNTQKQDNQVF